MKRFLTNVSLARYSNYKIGGPARYFFEAKNEADIVWALREWKKISQREHIDPSRFFILGGGTNILFSDRGFNGFVLKPSICFLIRRGMEISVGAGASMEELLAFAAREGLSGLEWAGGLPGTVGGALRGNAGAFGLETKDVVKSVESIDRKTGKIIKRKWKDCRFGYRMSIFKKETGNEIITAVTFRLKRGDPNKIRAAIAEKILYRKTRHPLDYPNIGSIFKNVPIGEIPKKHKGSGTLLVKNDPFPIVPTGFLIEKAGLKGVRRGGAMISPQHANFIVNLGNAKARHVKALIALAKKRTKKIFGVVIKEEVIRL